MKCLRCDHEWEARVPNPIRCPKCTSVLWNVPPQFRAVPRMDQVPVTSEAVAEFEGQHPEVNQRHEGPVPKMPVSVAPADQTLCPYTEFDRDSGETVYCALPPHDRKVRHVPGRRVSA